MTEKVVWGRNILIARVDMICKRGTGRLSVQRIAQILDTFDQPAPSYSEFHKSRGPQVCPAKPYVIYNAVLPSALFHHREISGNSGR